MACLGVSHAFDHAPLFSDVNFSLFGQGSLCVAGPNGSGKSTLLRILAGLIRPEAGEVVWREAGRALSRAEWFARLGFVSPDLHLYGELTVLENLRFYARVRRVAMSEPGAQSLFDRFGLVADQHKCFRELSSGLKQRARLACALLHEPRALLLDEPTSNLDRAGRDLVAELVHAQRRRGLLIVATNEEEEYSFGEELVRLG